jgi:O-antigen/teichoic acid export membrane protein
MTENKSLLKGILKLGSSSFSKILLFLLLLIAARFLGAEDFGKFSFALAFVYIFDPIFDPGLYHALIREIARKKNETTKYLAHALTWKLMVTPIFLFLTYLAANIIQSTPKAIYAVYLMAISFLLKSLTDTFKSTLLAHEFFGLNAICITIERVLLFLIGFLVLALKGGLLQFCLVFITVRLISLLIIIVFVKNRVCSVQIGKELKFLKALVFIAIPIGAIYITLNIYNYIDTVMLSALKNDIEVGWYNASYRIYEGLLFFPVIIGTVLMPRLSLLYKINLEEFKLIFSKGIKYIIIIGIFITFNGIFLSEKIIMLCFGFQYTNAIISTKVLLSGIMFVFLINFLQTSLITMDRQKVVLCLAAAGVVLNVISNLYLIPKYSYVGAAIATVLVEFILLIFFLVYTNKKIIKISLMNLIGKPIAAALIAIYLFWVIFPYNWFYIQILLINIMFLLNLYLMRIFDKEELTAFFDLRFLIKMSR